MNTDRLPTEYAYFFKGRGADSFCVAQTEKSLNYYLGGRSTRVVAIDDPSYFQKIKDAAALIVPGGSALEMRWAFGDAGFATIRGASSPAQEKLFGTICKMADMFPAQK